MNRLNMGWLWRLGIGARLFFALVLISSITILASGLTANTYQSLRDQLQVLQQHDIPELEAAAKLNDQSRIIVATAPLLVTAESNFFRKQAMQQLESSINSMDVLMRNLAGYDYYFRVLIAQISNSLNLLYQSVEQRAQLNKQLQLQSAAVYPLFLQVIVSLRQQTQWQDDSDRQFIINKLHYFAGLIEKVANDTTFNQLDHTFLRLEVQGRQISERLQNAPLSFHNTQTHQQLQQLLHYGDRSGELFKLQNQQLDSGYQQSYFLQNSLAHINQLAAQVNLHNDNANRRIDNSLQQAIFSINRNMQSSLILSLISLLAALAISWFYVRRNVLQRIIELQQNMRSIASAKLDTDIRIIGNDEVSAMARDLKHFQNTAIEVEKTSQRLGAEIEERILAERQLQATQDELIQSAKLAALGQMSVGINHEISQPLTAIASHLHIAGLRLEKQEYDAVVNSHTKISHLLNKINMIIGHLKSFTHRAGSELLTVNTHRVISEAIELMANKFSEQQCQLNYVENTAALPVLAQPIRLEQVIVNLLSNAINATQGCAKREVTIKAINQPHALWIEVHDSGVGIAPQQLTSIFDPFYTDRDAGEGLGLGLSISDSIIQGFGGQIRVHSTLGSGSCFTIILKLAEAS